MKRLRTRPARGRLGVEARPGGLTPAPASFIVDRIGELHDAGVDEIIFQPLPDAAYVQRVEEEIVAAFD